MKKKHDLPAPMGHSKGSPKRKVYTMTAYIKRSERSQINDLMLHLKLLENKNKQNPKQAEGET
jgi:hypothetical protein